MSVIAKDVRSSNWDGDSGSSIVILLHGYGSNEQDLTGLIPALGVGIPWASLRAPIELGNGGAAWFTITTPGDPDAGPVEQSTAAIWDWIDANTLAGSKVIPVGFSQGGLMATQLLRSRPERVAATVVLGGFVLSGAQPGDPEIATGRPPVFWGRGAEDRVITPQAVERTAAFLPEHARLIERVYAGLAHGISSSEVDDARAFLSEAVGPAVLIAG